MKALAEEAQSATATARLRKYMVRFCCFLPLEGEKIMTIHTERLCVARAEREPLLVACVCFLAVRWRVAMMATFHEGVESNESRTRTNTRDQVKYSTGTTSNFGFC